MFLLFWDGHWTIFFHDLPGSTHWDHTHQWSLVYLGCATSCLAQVLCMVVHWPLSYCPRIGKSHWQSWNKDTFCLCNHSARNRAEDFGKISSAVFFASAQRRIHENTTVPPLVVTCCRWQDIDWLLHPSAQVCKQTGWQGMMWLVELAWNFSESAVPWTWQGYVWHGSWIYRTGPYSPKQTKDMLVFFCCLTWLVFFA